ncbi:MAG: 2-amino-4-hydroxy-6-hydroxymethyldihydropteridine diphosphokinase [Dokdonella sp.]|uniref:2-amino-4-hydroxy-6- hydroxymethyldihydropteridine diphosphokinase n=1 Tax=Dokdonella sp. TaxID=2291710 RepID=UPI0027B88329|nr:2-amino-4-hydroxy-6-hydroxymethyldihydropteridine diphosphokinase [Dokdonella sp.]MCW5578226.1 2-amino-4-hydroxy-6-hydroxymethyldihydropteridine diphosphokinase [Dokdonella sp.]
MPTHWLLLLGSTLADDGRLRQALAALAELGSVRLLAPLQHGPGSRDPQRRYFNALVELVRSDGRDALVTSLKDIEQRLGRRRDDREVAIDIDLLAARSDGPWLADAHALAKGEFAQAHTRALLHHAGLAIQATRDA